MPIEPLPLPAIPPAPSRADPATFEERNDAAVEFQFNVLPPWIAGQVQRTFTNATDSVGAATAAVVASQAAVAAADSAVFAANVSEWQSGKTYTVGETVWSPIDKQTYRRTTNGAGTVDPSIDVSNWAFLGGVAPENGTAHNLSITGSLTEEVYSLSGTAPVLDPENGTIQVWMVTDDSAPVDGLSDGQSIMLEVHDGFPYLIDWPSIEWKTNGGFAPPLLPDTATVLIIWKVNSVLFGARVGDA